MTKRDFYEVLGLAREATPEEVKRAYRQAALKFHPDRNPGDKAAEERFKEAAEAYSVLIDSEKRVVYDRYGHDGLRHEGFGGFSGFDPSTFEDFEDILGNFFGFSFGDLFGGRGQGRRRRGQRGRDLALELELSLEEAATGLEKEITVSRAEACPDCRGSGLQPGTHKTTCSACQGRGQLRYQQGFFTVARTCTKCGGAGEVVTSPCAACRGEGRARRKRTLTVKIPAGVDDGSRLRLAGEGEAGDAGHSSGDLYIIVRLRKHEIFERQGDDLHRQVDISFPRAALGGRIEVGTLDGREVLKVPPG
ncbi:MAG: molecular chaperone DnaJ, partial [Candidatus Aminicenantes bacterium]|nr:molecular chaperone DnaJ [Candidatus Aminicenantes bacterium]